jgi:hypothetical protein
MEIQYCSGVWKSFPILVENHFPTLKFGSDWSIYGTVAYCKLKLDAVTKQTSFSRANWIT